MLLRCLFFSSFLLIDFSQSFHRGDMNALRGFEVVQTGQVRNSRAAQP